MRDIYIAPKNVKQNKTDKDKTDKNRQKSRQMHAKRIAPG